MIDWTIKISDVASVGVGLGAAYIAYRGFRLARETSENNLRALADGVRPALDVDFHMDRNDTRISLANKGIGVAVINSVLAIHFDNSNTPQLWSTDPFRVFVFEQSFDWDECTTFPPTRRRYLRPGDSYVLLHITRDFLNTQSIGSSWIDEQSIVDICHSINHQLGRIEFRVEYDNIRGEKMEPFVFDCRPLFPLPNTPKPRSNRINDYMFGTAPDVAESDPLAASAANRPA